MSNPFSKWTRKLTETALTANARVFALFGELNGVWWRATIVGLCTLALLIGLATGVSEVEYANDLSKLWVTKGSRAENEQKIIQKWWGSNGGGGIISYTLGQDHTSPRNDDDKGILTLERMKQLFDLTTPLIVPGSEYNVVKGGITYDFTDICSRPPVPLYLQDWSFNDNANPDPTINLNINVGMALATGRYASGSVFGISRCIAGKAYGTLLAYTSATIPAVDLLQLQLWYGKTETEINAILDSGPSKPLNAGLSYGARPGLPFGWGIAKAPCTRASIMDCWKDSEVELGDGLNVLSQYALSLLSLEGSNLLVPGQPYNFLELYVFATTGAFDTGASTDKRWYSSCRAGIESTVALNGASVEQQQLLSALLDVAPKFYGAGAWFRPTMADQNAPNATLPPAASLWEDDLASNFFQSMKNTYSKDYEAYGGSFPVCVAVNSLRLLQYVTLKSPAPGFVLKFSPTVFQGLSNPNLYNYFQAASGALGWRGSCCHNWIGRFLTPQTFVGRTSVPDNFYNYTGEDRRFLFSTRINLGTQSPDDKQLQQRLATERGFVITADVIDKITEISDALDDVWIARLQPLFEKAPDSELAGSDIDMAYIVNRSETDLFKDAANVEAALLLGGYLALIIYSCANFIIWSCPPKSGAFVYSRSLFFLVGLVAIGLSNLSSFGFMAYIGYLISPLNSSLVPFLAVGLGLSDLFVLVHMFDKHCALQDNVPERMTTTMADAGSSITVTSTANAAAFFIPGMLVELPAVQMFAFHMTAAIVLNWITMIFLIVPLMHFEAQRSKSRRSVILPCIKADDAEVDINVQNSRFSMHHLINSYLIHIYVNPIFKAVVVALFLGGTAYLGYSGFEESVEGLRLGDVVLKGSAFKASLDLVDQDYPLLSGSFITGNINFTDSLNNEITLPQFQSNVLHVLDDVKGSYYVDDVNNPRSLNWLAETIDFFNENMNPGPALEVIPPPYFYLALRQYLSTPEGGVDLSSLVCVDSLTWEQEIDCSQVNGDSIIIVASQSLAFYVNIVTDEDYVKAILDIRSKADNSIGQLDAGNVKIVPTPMFMTGSLMRFWTQYIDIKDVLLRSVGFATIGVFIVVCLLQLNFLSSLLVGVILLATVIQLYGFIPIIGIKVNGFSLLNLACSVGLSVSFSAYVSYSYLRMNARTDDPNERMKLCVIEMFPSMFESALSAFIAVITLGFAKYPFFKQYYFYMVSIMIWISFINGIVVLPVLLSIFNPLGLDKVHRLKSLGSNGQADDKFVDDGL